MSDSDQSLTNLRYNQITQSLEAFGGGSPSWTVVPLHNATGNYITALTNDATATGPGSAVLTLAAVNSNVGSFINANITVDAKGRVLAAANGSAGPAVSSSIQIVSDTFTSTTGTTYLTIGGMSTNFALGNAAHKVKMTWTGSVDVIPAGTKDQCCFSFFRDGVDLAVSVYGLGSIQANAGGPEIVDTLTITFLDSPGNTASHTYSVRMRTVNAVATVASSAQSDNIFILEEVV